MKEPDKIFNVFFREVTWPIEKSVYFKEIRAKDIDKAEKLSLELARNMVIVVQEKEAEKGN